MKLPGIGPAVTGRLAASRDRSRALDPARSARARGELRRPGPVGLEGETVFVSETRSGELESWIEVAGIGRPASIRSASHFYIAAQAAMAGQGCIIGPPLVLADLIEQGRLVAPFPDIMAKGATTLTAVFHPDRCKTAFVEKLLRALFRGVDGHRRQHGATSGHWMVARKRKFRPAHNTTVGEAQLARCRCRPALPSRLNAPICDIGRWHAQSRRFCNQAPAYTQWVSCGDSGQPEAIKEISTRADRTHLQH
jgi:hypothetical protein